MQQQLIKSGEPEGTFTEGGTYIPPGFEGATTIDGDSPT